MAAEEINYLDELVRLQAVNLRRSMTNQAEAIIELGNAGLSNTRIADLLGTSPATVRVTLARSKKHGGE